MHKTYTHLGRPWEEAEIVDRVAAKPGEHSTARSHKKMEEARGIFL